MRISNLNMTKMKRLLYILFFAAFALVLVNCEEVDDDFDIGATSLPGYVEFNQEDTVSISEGGNLEVEIELPVAKGENVNVTYQIISEGAVYGVDYTVDTTGVNSDGSGGTATIVFVDSTENADTFVLPIVAPEDGVTDGDKYITFKITSATTASGEVLTFGQPGQDGEFTVKLVDINCPSALDGTYDAGNSCFASDSSTPVWTETATNGVYDVTDFTGGYYAYAGAPEIGAVVKDGCGNLSIDDFVAFGVLEFVNMSGKVNSDGSMTIIWTEASGYGNSGNPVTCTTTFTPQ